MTYNVFGGTLLNSTQHAAVRAHLFQRHWPNAAVLANDVVQVNSHLLLDEAQQMLLIHTRRSVYVSVNLQFIVQ